MFKHIIANKRGIPVEINQDAGEDVALVVATRDHKTYTTKTSFFTNDIYGHEMAQNGAFSGTPILLHDGVDTVAWTFSDSGAKWTADSSDTYYADSQSMKCSNPIPNEIMQIINNIGPGNDIDMTGNYVAVTMWINVNSNWLAGDSFSLYAHIDGGLVGNKVLLEDYFLFSDYNVWQYINIPLTDLGIESSSIDAFRIENEAREGGLSPTFYIDEWYLQEAGTPIDFELKPDKGTWLHIKAIQTVIVDAYNADNADSTMYHLAYDQILGVTTTTGIIYKRYTEGNIIPTFEPRIINLMDYLSPPCSEITNAVSDGTNTMITIINSYPKNFEIVLKAEDLDKIVITVEGKFDDLLYFRTSVMGTVEQREW